MKHTCKQCGECCKYLEFVLDKTDINIEFYTARGVTFHEYDDHIVVNVPHICDKLRGDHRGKFHCSIHETKPESCKLWPQWYDGYPEPCIYGVE